MCKKILRLYFIYFDDYCAESAGSKRFLLKLNLFARLISNAKIFFFNLIRNNIKSFFANTDFICDVLLYKRESEFLGGKVINIGSTVFLRSQNSPSSFLGASQINKVSKRLHCDEGLFVYKFLTKIARGFLSLYSTKSHRP